MARMTWTGGCHEVNCDFSYYVYIGRLMWAIMRGEHLTPYKSNPKVGYDNASGIKANKRNYDKLIWR